MENVKRQSSLPKAKRNVVSSSKPVQTLLESTKCFSVNPTVERKQPQPATLRTKVAAVTASPKKPKNPKNAAKSPIPDTTRKTGKGESVPSAQAPIKTSTSRAGINYLQYPSLFPVEELEECGIVVRENKSRSAPRSTASSKKCNQTVSGDEPEVASKRTGKSSVKNPGVSPLPQSSPPQPASSQPRKPRELSAIASPAAAPVSHVRAASVLPGMRRYASLAGFVSGLSNRLAKTAAEVVVDHPGKMNPLYIHGGTSFGKTHLLEGICSETRKYRDRKPALFMTAEQFTSAFIEGLKSGTPSFRNKFRGISMLLIDDIPFLSGKSGTQSEFLQLIDRLKAEGVQMVFSGDRPLNELKGIRPEILSRLESGMVCGIEPPERETLLDVFRQMIRQRGLPFSDEVARFVVSRLNSNVRQLSGALNRLHTAHLAGGKPMTVKQAEDVLEDMIRCNRKSVKLVDIEKVVCDTFGLGLDSLQSRSRTKQVSTPRMLAMWLARKYTRNALSEIGKYFGNRSHSTVVSAQKKVDSWISADAEVTLQEQHCPISELIRQVERNLQAG